MPDDYTLMTKESHPVIMEHVERMCGSAGLETIPPIHIVRSDEVGARVQDVNGDAIGGIEFLEVTDRTLEVLSDKEAAALLAHEIAHDWLPNHKIVSADKYGKIAGAVLGYSVIRLVSAITSRMAKEADNPREYDRRKFLLELGGMVTSGYGVYQAVTPYANREAYEAHSRVDKEGAVMLGDVDAMISALKKIKEHAPQNTDKKGLDYRIEALEAFKIQWEKQKQAPSSRSVR